MYWANNSITKRRLLKKIKINFATLKLILTFTISNKKDMKTTVKFLGLDSDNFAVVSVENSFAITYAVYCPIDMVVVAELEDVNVCDLTEVYNPLSYMDNEVIIEWFESVLN